MTVVAPKAPGALGVAAQPQAMLAYLQALGEWVTERRAELDAIDQAMLTAGRSQELTPDMTLSMALWQAVKTRQDLILTTWDSGRVGPTELDRLSALIWGGLDTGLDTGAYKGMAMSLPEACRLSDALTGQLRTKLQLEPDAEQVAVRIRDLRAQLERLRDQVALEPPDSRPTAEAKVGVLVQRTAELVDKSARGGDVGGLLGPLEAQAATFERDLIVNGALRRQNQDKVDRVRQTISTLTAREVALKALVAGAVTQVSPAPKYAVPDVAALGPIPATGTALDEYAARLDKVDEAMTFVQRAYTDAMNQHAAAVGLHEALQAKTQALGMANDADLAKLSGHIGEFLRRKPTPITVTQQLLTAYQSYLDWLTTEARP